MYYLRFAFIFFPFGLTFAARHHVILTFDHSVNLTYELRNYQVVTSSQGEEINSYRVTIESPLSQNTLIQELSQIATVAEANQKAKIREMMGAGQVDSRSIVMLDDDHDAPDPDWIRERDNDERPDPSIYGQDWLDRIRVDKAWPHSTGQGVVVAVLDTGIDMNHEYLRDNISPWGIDFVDEDYDPSEERRGIDTNGNGVLDEGWGHGTHVAGIIKTVAPDVILLPIRIADSDGHAELFDIVEGIAYATMMGVDIINLSMSIDKPSPILQDWLAYAQALNITIVTSAGNNNLNEVKYPGNVRGVITVTSIGEDLVKSPFANYAYDVSVAAQGENVLSTAPGNRYIYRSGTSMAAPIVAGQAAIILQLVPYASRWYVEDRILWTAKPIYHVNAFQHWDKLGTGYADVWNAITVENLKK
ncbi:S8 family peptidase [Acanthopleuribacter pedis]|uniref:S8 family serine peptidase n=1 Tax=Acanthopleuribacter pedis TaxID=442870 RepID=A0A8J7QJ24_9BACT|nr:S8 family serine peptidase [Acanthopleuribacter pedis]MBO1323295.1 S8 family serine peptidase [Acanthopleuribacter pedis]